MFLQKALLLAFSTLCASSLLAQNSKPSYSSGSLAIYPLDWTEQLPPTLVKASLEGQCLTLETQFHELWRYPTVFAKLSRNGKVKYDFTLSKDTILSSRSLTANPTVSASVPGSVPGSVPTVYVYGVNTHHLAILSPGWLETLASDFRPDTLKPTPCDTLENSISPSVKTFASSLESLPLIEDTVNVIIGAVQRSYGLKKSAIHGSGQQELAGYDETRDSIFFDMPRLGSVAQVRYALLHEYGHRLDIRHGSPLAPFVPSSWVPTPERMDRHEYMADLAAYALSLISETSRVDPRSAYAIAQLYEYLLPGTIRATGYFLRYPLFQRHPLFPYAKALESGSTPLAALRPR